MPQFLEAQLVNLIILFILLTMVTVWLLKEFKKTHLKSIKDLEGASLNEIGSKNYQLLHQAIEKSQQIIAEAEGEGVKIADQSKFITTELEAKYEKLLAEAVELTKQRFYGSVVKAEEEFVGYLLDLKTRGQQVQSLIDNTITEKVNDLFQKLDNNLTSVVTKSVASSLATIQKELVESRTSVENYQARQLRLIDENIIDVLEKTLSIVLVKKLSLKDQLDLVYEALEKAKVEKFLTPAESAQNQPSQGEPPTKQ